MSLENDNGNGRLCYLLIEDQSMKEAWSSEWQKRFHAQVQHLGYDDVFAFVMSRRGESFGEMFRSLRQAATPDDFGPLALRQLEEAFYIDAASKGKLREAFMEALVRSLGQYLRQGWNRGKRINERRIDALTRWPTPSLVSGWKYDDWKVLRERAWDEIQSSTPPDDWCPKDHSDPIIQSAITRVWPNSDESDNNCS